MTGWYSALHARTGIFDKEVRCKEGGWWLIISEDPKDYATAMTRAAMAARRPPLALTEAAAFPV